MNRESEGRERWHDWSVTKWDLELVCVKFGRYRVVKTTDLFLTCYFLVFVPTCERLVTPLWMFLGSQMDGLFHCPKEVTSYGSNLLKSDESISSVNVTNDSSKCDRKSQFVSSSRYRDLRSRPVFRFYGKNYTMKTLQIIARVRYSDPLPLVISLGSLEVTSVRLRYRPVFSFRCFDSSQEERFRSWSE